MLLAGPIFHTSTQYKNFVEIFNILLDLCSIYFAHFELPLCIVVTLSQNAITSSGVKLSMRLFCFNIGNFSVTGPGEKQIKSLFMTLKFCMTVVNQLSHLTGAKFSV